MRLFLCILSILSGSGLARAATPLFWAELDTAKSPALTENILLGNVTLPEGTAMHYLHGEFLDVPAIWIQLRAESCPDMAARSEMVLIKPKATEHDDSDRSVGVELEPGCLLNVYVENKDLYYPSFLQELSDGTQRRER